MSYLTNLKLPKIENPVFSQFSVTSLPIVLILLLFIVLACIQIYRLRLRQAIRAISPAKPTSEPDVAEVGSRSRRGPIAPFPIYRDPTRRAVFGLWGCDVYGWPSKGGVIIRSGADAVELEYLGFNRLDPPAKRCADQEEEDKFCTALLKIGGKWWSSEERSIRAEASGGILDELTDREMKEVFVGWPSNGGVLIAEFQNEVGENRVPHDIGRLGMAFTMEERCEMLTNRFGARHYRD